MSLTRKQIVEIALKFSEENTDGARWAAVVDFTAPPDKERYFEVDVKNRKIVYSWYTSHGSGSGPMNGRNLKFSNIPNSRMSSDGLLETGHTYVGRYGRSLKLHGLEPGYNDKVYARYIVMHKSDYVRKEFVRDNDYPGRSWGCITLNPETKDRTIYRLEGGSIIFIATKQSLKRHGL